MKHILYVDDEPDIREVVTLSLSLGDKFRVTAAASGVAALSLLEQGLRPDAIMLDVMMPDLDGPGTLSRIRAQPNWEAIPVIFITARALQAEKTQLMALGARGILTKPFDPMLLSTDVAALLDDEA